MQKWKLHHRDDELEYFGFSFKDLPLNVIKTCKVLRISGQGDLVVGVDADQLALKEDEILKMFGNECERGAASASHGGSSCTYLIYRTKTCSSTFAFRGEGNKYLTALMVDRY